MKICLAAVLLVGVILSARAELEIVTPDEPQVVFSGGPASVSVKIHNPADKRATNEYFLQLLQLSSSVVMPVEKVQPWKTIEVLPGQTILEAAPINLPAVRALTAFRLQVSGPGQAVARISLFACPPDMLARLKESAGEAGIGLHDPDGKIKPVLANAGVSAIDLELSDRGAGFRGRLAILGPYAAGKLPSPEWKEIAAKLAGRGIGVVVLLPRTPGSPSAEILRDGPVVTAQGMKWDDLATSASAQLSLLRLVELTASKTVP